MAPLASSKLFLPITVGNVRLEHRIVMAPLTRTRADSSHVHRGIGVEYYSQRASTPGTLIISEATFISQKASGIPNPPGIWSPEQIQGWRKVIEAVHARGWFIFCQLWALGRAASPRVLAETGNDYPSASAIPLGEEKAPRPLSIEEIREYVQDYTQAARNAIEAGFDGVELHAGHGYLPDQFLQDVTNQRTDAYGGSIENRTRFVLEILESISNAIGQSRTAVRFSPWSKFQEMRMSDPLPTFTHVLASLSTSLPNLAYISLTEPLVFGDNDSAKVTLSDSNEPFRQIWAPRPVILGGGYSNNNNLDRAVHLANDKGVLILFGRAFISNPDLPQRFKKGINFTPYDRKTFYSQGPEKSEGYIDYPFATERPSL
ncbi:hypothetical protein BS47DRAFT_1326090 [Hydnum rufescens UP504]|uniref:NADH:flavin oxidoreductase/NADH oxidase N-terminal domain-containing protein n=1 Tax=Hydnum rufescens UP504 TaxID=1448309 RepID=A0A9P6B4Q9_9AGAM|nr:hypothetical protein BS47DRAFT_1326090 [Hydnum rufescens UP504]